MEIAILNFIQENLRNSFLDSFFVFITSLGNSGMIWIAAGITMLFFKKSRPYGIMTLISLLFTLIMGEFVLKNIFERARPCVVNYDYIKNSMLIPIPKSYSFPSGHTASSFTAAFVICKFKVKLGIPAYILASLIAFSRMYLYVHYPTDILGGIILGTVCAFVMYKAYSHAHPKGIKKPIIYNEKGKMK